ncbi:MAG: hypothetical protein PWQ37_1997 [Candidatus Petromonas sp.]|nr:hypothetical protein [Candidatus Petromonas sp.]
MNYDDIINVIVKEVFKRLKNPPKKVLAIFTGASIGFNEGVKELHRLKKDGWDIKVLLSKNAEHVLTEDLVKEMLDIEEIYVESKVKGMKDLYSDIDMMIIPTLTLNSAAKIALCIADTLTTNLVAHGIMEGIPIIACRDACDLRNETRLKLGMNKTPKTYLNKVDEYLNTIESYGIKLVSADKLYNCATGKSDSQLKNEKKSSGNSVVLNKKVISRGDIIKASSRGNTMIVSENSIITSFAKDAAKELGIKIVTG